MLFFAIYTAIIFVCGVAIGATLFRDLLDGLWIVPRKPRPLPLARVLHDAQWKRLDLPTARRRQLIEVVRE